MQKKYTITFITILFILVFLAGGVLYNRSLKVDYRIKETISRQPSSLNSTSSLQTNAIRQINFQKFFSEDPIIKKECFGGSINLVEVNSVDYHDLDNDGAEEAIVTASSCLSGTSGADIVSVYKLLDSGIIIELPVEFSSFQEFNGRKIGEGFEGHYYLEVEKDQLVGTFPIYRENDSNCCPSGGTRVLYFQWDGSKFALVKVEDISPKK